MRLERSRLRLEALPTVARARVDYRPEEGGGARVEGAVTRHPTHTLGKADLPAHALRALGGRVELAATDRAELGERAVLAGRVDRGFGAVALALDHPVPGSPGTVAGWELHHRVLRPRVGPASGVRLSRSGLRLAIRPPPGGWARVEGWVGVDRLEIPGEDDAVPGAGFRGRLDGPAGLAVAAEGSRWRGGAGTGELRVLFRPRPMRGGVEFRASGSLLALSDGAPPDLAPRFGGGPSATHRARGAPPGSITLLPPGRRWLHGTAEVARIRATGHGIALGAALFVDGVVGLERSVVASPGGTLGTEPRFALHPGVGLRAGVPGVDGLLRVDLALDPRAERLRLSMGW
jgi:hypothetical protein